MRVSLRFKKTKDLTFYKTIYDSSGNCIQNTWNFTFSTLFGDLKNNVSLDGYNKISTAATSSAENVSRHIVFEAQIEPRVGFRLEIGVSASYAAHLVLVLSDVKRNGARNRNRKN
jgi:hypothetical protein